MPDAKQASRSRRVIWTTFSLLVVEMISEMFCGDFSKLP